MQYQNLFLRNDTFFGVCEAIGSDFGFNPNWLRVAFAFALFFDPMLTASVYLALCVPIALARWFYPARTAQSAEKARPTEDPITVAVNEEQQELPLAA